MARITVEDCIDKFPSRFELVLVASQRARKLHSGDNPTVEKDNDKNTVIALREIADSTITVEEMKEHLIQEYQTISINDEEEENIEIESETTDENSEANANDDTESSDSIDKDLSSDKQDISEAEKEIEDLIISEDSELEQQYNIEEDITTDDSSVDEKNHDDTTSSD